jgi:parallel beta-helix repeat protein
MKNNTYAMFAVMIVMMMLPGVVHAVDGVILINQASALAGGVTEGDAPGFPVRISQPGSYRLSSNLNVPGQNINGIEIRANDVTIDLNGFRIRGNARSGIGVLALPAPPPAFAFVGIAIRNGTISNFETGINLFDANQSVVEHIRVSESASNGILAGDGSIVNSNTASRNDGQGIVAGEGSIVSSNTAFQNQAGIFASMGSTVSSNTAFQNTDGIGMAVTCPSTVIGNTVTLNVNFNIVFFDRGLGSCTSANNVGAP